MGRRHMMLWGLFFVLEIICPHTLILKLSLPPPHPLDKSSYFHTPKSFRCKEQTFPPNLSSSQHIVLPTSLRPSALSDHWQPVFVLFTMTAHSSENVYYWRITMAERIDAKWTQLFPPRWFYTLLTTGVCVCTGLCTCTSHKPQRSQDTNFADLTSCNTKMKRERWRGVAFGSAILFAKVYRFLNGHT